MKRPHMKYLDTLRRVPDDIILDVAARDLDLMSGRQCLCGWFVRDKIASINGIDPENVDAFDWTSNTRFSPSARSAQLFGGSEREWNSIYNGVAEDEKMPDVEMAFVIRVKEAVGV